MTGFNDILTRGNSGNDLPVQLAKDLVTAVVRDSVLMSLGRKVQTKTLDSLVPVVTGLPKAFWVVGDQGLKQTTGAQIQNLSLLASEVASVIPVPIALLDDSAYDVWSVIKPLAARALAKKIDEAAIFGNDVPMQPDGTTPAWPASVVASAIAAGAVTPYTDDPVESLLNAAILVSEQGYSVKSSAVANGWQFRASVARAQSVIANPAGSLYPLSVAGIGIHSEPLTWHSDVCDGIVGDFDQVLCAVRQDVTITIHTDGVVSDETGKVVLNLMQQDSVAMRTVMRVAYRTLALPTDVDPTSVVTSSGHLSALSPVAIVGPHA